MEFLMCAAESLKMLKQKQQNKSVLQCDCCVNCLSLNDIYNLTKFKILSLKNLPKFLVVFGNSRQFLNVSK